MYFKKDVRLGRIFLFIINNTHGMTTQRTSFIFSKKALTSTPTNMFCKIRKRNKSAIGSLKILSLDVSMCLKIKKEMNNRITDG